VPFLVSCPNCGPREATEFVYGGELVPRPMGRSQGRRELSAYLYFRSNPAGEQAEWWFHEAGCGRWLIAERNTLTGDVASTTTPAGRRAATGQEEPDAGPGEPGG
jgi:heterotetrameric sarcosine oxidase delta subunit